MLYPKSRQKRKISLKNPIVTVSLIIALALVLRSYHLSTDLLFHRDQGLHSLSIWNIWHEKNLSLLGHPSDVDGLIHAPIYYWLMLPAYALSGGNPVTASLFQIGLEIASMPLLYLAIKKLFNQKTATLTLLLYSISYGGVSLSRWLVNVTPILPLVNLLLFILVKQINTKVTSPAVTKPNKQPSHLHKYLSLPASIVLGPKLGSIFITSLIVGIITQLNAAVGVFLLPLIFWFYRSRLNLKLSCLILAGFLAPALPVLIFELRHNFVISTAILSFSRQPEQGIGLRPNILLNNLNILLIEINKLIAYPYTYISGFLFILGLYQVRRLKQASFIYSFILIPFLFLSLFQRGAIGFFFVSLFPLTIAIVAHGLRSLPTTISRSLLTLVIVLNFIQLPNIYQPNNALIPIGNANIITLQDRKNIIDFMYKKANGKQFSVWFYTIPYFQEEVWDYMFSWYAKKQYGYLPEATSGFSPNDLKESQMFFAVYEPDEDQPTKLASWQQRIIKEFGPVTEFYSSRDLTISLHPL